MWCSQSDLTISFLCLYGCIDLKMVERNNLVKNDEVESHALIVYEGASQDMFGSQTMGGGNHDTFFPWWMNGMVTQPPPTPTPITVPIRLALVDQTPNHRPSIDKVYKCWVTEFLGLYNVDQTKVEYWLKKMQWVLDELNCSLMDSLKCSVSLLKEDAYQWWITLTSVTHRDHVTWEFFQAKFKKKYVSQLYLEEKKREFLDLKNMSCGVWAQVYESKQVCSGANNFWSWNVLSIWKRVEWRRSSYGGDVRN